jgi:hypothetical protein
MKYLNKSAAVIMSLGILASCADGTKVVTGKKTISTSAILASDAPANTKAEQLALAAEQLLTPSGFIYADMILDMALQLDANNKRAGLYKSFLASSMATKGILARIKPLAEKDANSKKKLEELISKMQEGSLKTFLLDGKGDIKDEKDAQAFTDSVINGMGKFRQFLKANKNLNIELNINDYLSAGTRTYSYERYCNTYPVGNGDYETDCWVNEEDVANSTVSKVSLNRADIEALQHITAGYQIYGALLNSYSVSGAIKVAQNNDGNQSATTQKIWKDLARDAEFGKLRNDIYSQIPELGSDAIMGVRWAMSAQSELCPAGEDRPNSRPGTLFGNGLCIKQTANEVEKTLEMVELALKGQRIPVKIGDSEVEIAPVAITTNPVKDLKALKPVFNKCGKLASVSDDTLNGVFPNGDLNEALSVTSDCPDYYNDFNEI